MKRGDLPSWNNRLDERLGLGKELLELCAIGVVFKRSLVLVLLDDGKSLLAVYGFSNVVLWVGEKQTAIACEFLRDRRGPVKLVTACKDSREECLAPCQSWRKQRSCEGIP